MPHALPHEPQLVGSNWVLVQEPLHACWPAAHAQLPLEQLCPGKHVRPQVPQLSTSVLVSVQRPPHWVSPASGTMPQPASPPVPKHVP